MLACQQSKLSAALSKLCLQKVGDWAGARSSEGVASCYRMGPVGPAQYSLSQKPLPALGWELG